MIDLEVLVLSIFREDYLSQGGKIKAKKGRAIVTKGSAESGLATIQEGDFIKSFPCPPAAPDHEVTFDRIVCSHAAIFVAGKFPDLLIRFL